MISVNKLKEVHVLVLIIYEELYFNHMSYKYVLLSVLLSYLI